MRKTMAGLGLAGLLLGAGANGAGAQEAPGSFELSPLNESEAVGTTEVALEGTMLRVVIASDGLLPGAPHAQHIHFQPGQPSRCPSMADAGDDGVLTTPEGQPAYGPIQIPLTTEGDFGQGSALAVDRFPVADAEGEIAYERTFELPQALADQLRGQTFAIVQHGVDLDDSGAYDGAASSLDPAVPLEATLPADCGIVTLAAATGSTTTTTQATTTTTQATTSTTTQATTSTTTAPSAQQSNDTDAGRMPVGGMATGAGGTADEVEDGVSAAAVAAIAGVAAAGLLTGGVAVARARVGRR